MSIRRYHKGKFGQPGCSVVVTRIPVNTPLEEKRLALAEAARLAKGK